MLQTTPDTQVVIKILSDYNIVWVFFFFSGPHRIHISTGAFLEGMEMGIEVSDYKIKQGKFCTLYHQCHSGTFYRHTSVPLLLETWDDVSSSLSSAVLSWEFWDVISSP